MENLKPGKIRSIGRKGDKFKVNFGKTWDMIDRFANGKGKACFKKLNDENVPNELGNFCNIKIWKNVQKCGRKLKAFINWNDA